MTKIQDAVARIEQDIVDAYKRHAMMKQLDPEYAKLPLIIAGYEWKFSIEKQLWMRFNGTYTNEFYDPFVPHRPLTSDELIRIAIYLETL